MSRPSSLTTLLRLSALLAEIISLLFGGAVRLLMLRWLPILTTRGGTTSLIYYIGIFSLEEVGSYRAINRKSRKRTVRDLTITIHLHPTCQRFWYVVQDTFLYIKIT